MTWKDIIKSANNIRKNWINSKTPPDLYYYDKLPIKLKKEFDELFEKMIDDIQRKYLQGVEEMFRTVFETENMRGMYSLKDGGIREFNFQIAPKSSSVDKYGRFSNYYLYFDKMVKDSELGQTQSAYITSEEWDNLMETILNVKG